MNWDNGWHHDGIGAGGLLFMAVMMLAFWGGLAWLVITLIRGDGPSRHPAPPVGDRPDPEQILHERVARGEIDIDEYHQRIDALRAKRPAP